MRKKKNTEAKAEVTTEEKEFEKQLACDDKSKRENEMIDLLKQIANQNEQVIQLLTKLKERFI